MTATLTDREALLAAICASPADDLPRRVYADHLEDHPDHPSDADRAAFIRAQVGYAKLLPRCDKELTPLEDEPTSPRFYRKNCRCQTCSLRRTAYLRGRRWWVWEWSAGETVRPAWEGQVLERLRADPYIIPDPPPISGAFSRGFIDSVRLPLAAFILHAPALFRSHPVTRVVLSDREPLEYPRGPYRWLLWAFSSENAGPAPERDPESLSQELFDLLGSPHPTVADYPTRDAALEALSRAAVSYGRNLVGLPPL